MKEYGLLHCYTQYSLNQSPSSIKDIIERAKALEATSIAITDNNTMTGIIEFYNECKKNNINPIIGSEINIIDDSLKCAGNIVVLAKNYQGYTEICKAISLANIKASKTDDEIFLTFKDIKNIFNNKNVIVLSGGQNGILYNLFKHNVSIENQISECVKKQKVLDSPQDEAYKKNLTLLEKMTQEVEYLTNEKEKLKAIADKKFINVLKGLDSLKKTDYELYVKKAAAVDEEIKNSKKAKERINVLKNELTQKKRTQTILKKKIEKMENSHKEYKNIQKEIFKLKNTLINSSEIDIIFKSIIANFYNFFNDDFYLELFDNETSSSCEFINKLVNIAENIGCKYVATCMSCIVNKEDSEILQLIKSLKDNEWEKLNYGEENLYLKSKNEINNRLLKYTSQVITTTALFYNVEICKKCRIEFSEKKHYPKYITDNSCICDNSPELLIEKLELGIKARGYNKENLTNEYIERLQYELNVIISMGFSDYFLIVADYVNYGKELAKRKNEFNIGYGIGPGRGSVVGSLVSFFLKITNIDPIKHKLKFERFLNSSRITMPDIDIDFSDEIRMEVINYVKNKYGKNSVALIRTVNTQQAKASIRNVARILGIKYFNNNTKYYSLGDEICKAIPKNTSINEYKEILIKEFSNHEDIEVIKEIVNIATKIENSINNISVHAAGVVIGDGKPLYNYVPLLYNANMKQLIVQCDMTEVEQLNLLKMDFLGLKTLDIITECLRRIYKYTGKIIDIDKIPFDIKVYSEIFCKGNTNSVFQFESEGMKNTLKDFQPKCFDDIVLLIAAYRPGPKDFIPDIIKVKNGEKKPYYCIPELEDILKDTYGYPIYQEQIMDIFSICAGFSQNEADIIRRYMSKKKEKQFLQYKERFIAGLISHNATLQDSIQLWESLIDFSKYGFNKSHACSYALLSYQTAYLKYHFSEYFMCSVLNNTDIKKISKVLIDCNHMNITVSPPDINYSLANFENYNGRILYGLNKIKDIRDVNPILEERRNGKYTSFKDFLYRVNVGDALIESLVKSGAMDNFEKNRNKMLSLITPLKEIVKAIKKYEAEYSRFTNEITICTDNKEKIKIKAKINNLKIKLDKIIDIYKNYELFNIVEQNLLDEEYKLLGGFLSEHPLDKYKSIYTTNKITKISEFTIGYHTFCGLIKDINIKKRKKDGKEMAFFNLMDITGEISVSCFAETYDKYKDFIKPNNIIKIYGNCVTEDKYNNESTEIKLIVKEIDKCNISKNPILVSIPNASYEEYAYNTLKNFEYDNGHPIWLHYKDNGLIHEKKLKVTKKILKSCDNILQIYSLFSEK